MGTGALLCVFLRARSCGCECARVGSILTHPITNGRKRVIINAT